MEYFHQPPLGGLRQRAMQPLTGRDGSCPLIYDLERHRLVEVPSEFHFHAAPAIENGNLDDDLIGWLANEDLLTYSNRPAEPRNGWRGPVSGEGPLAHLDRVFVFDHEVHCRLGGLDTGAALSVVRSVLAGRHSAAKVVFHLDDGGLPAAASELAALVSAVRRATARSLPSVGFELLSDGRALTPALVRFLADHDFTVCLTAPEIRALDLLLEGMPDRFVLSVVLDTGDQLADLWREARKLQVHRLEAVKITDKPFARLSLHAMELRQFRRDLFAICDDMYEELAAGQQPRTVYEPLVRVIGRQLAGRLPDGRPYLGVLSHGEMFPFFAPPQEDAASAEGDDEVDDSVALAASSCESCWARRRCTRGQLAGPAADPRRPEPRADRCEFWRAEVEVGLLFFHRLQQADPAGLLGFAEGREERVFDPYAHLGFQELKTC